MKIKMNQDQLKSHCESELEDCVKEKNDWLKRFNKNAMDALSWSDGLFVICAKEELHEEILEAVKNGTSVEDIVNYTLREVLSGAGRIPASTSSGHNRCEQAKLKAKADLLEALTSRLR